MQQLVVYLPIAYVIDKLLCYRGKKRVKLTPLRKLQAKGETSSTLQTNKQTLLQRHQYIPITQKIYQSSRFNNVFRKMPPGNNFFFQISGVRTGVCAYIYAMLRAFFYTLMHNLRKLLSEPYSNLKPRISDFKAFNILQNLSTKLHYYLKQQAVAPGSSG